MSRKNPKICFILGTRPEIIKLSSLIKECESRHADFFILHTNQHYSDALDRIFFRELGLPPAKYNLGIGSGTHGAQTGAMIAGIEKVLIKERPGVVLVEGDTNTVLAGALAAAKLHITVGHIEAGLRSYFRGMPEEVNRILTDHCSDILFAPTRHAREILLGEGIPGRKVIVTGNTIVDAVYRNALSAEKRFPLKNMGLKPKGYFLLTLHREENVDDRKRLASVLNAMGRVHALYGVPILYPIHPRARKMIRAFNLTIPKGLRIVPPVGYLDFLALQKSARLVFTDSGGIQEESCILKVPCVTLRDNTERPETVEVGGNILAGVEPGKILRATKEMLRRPARWKNPFGDGKAYMKILKALR